MYLHRLDGLGPNAYEAFQTSRDLRAVVNKVLRAKNGSTNGELTRTISVNAQLMTPIQPMLVCLLDTDIFLSLYFCLCSIVRLGICYQNVLPLIYLSVTLLIKAVQDIEILFSPYNSFFRPDFAVMSLGVHPKQAH